MRKHAAIKPVGLAIVIIALLIPTVVFAASHAGSTTGIPSMPVAPNPDCSEVAVKAVVVAPVLPPAPPSGCPQDDRVNSGHGDDNAILYSRKDDKGRPALHVYCVSENGKGTLAKVVTQDMLNDYPEYPNKPDQNTELFSIDTCRVPINFYVLTSGEYQVNIGPGADSEVDVIIFTGLPPKNVRFLFFKLEDDGPAS